MFVSMGRADSLRYLMTRLALCLFSARFVDVRILTQFTGNVKPCFVCRSKIRAVGVVDDGRDVAFSGLPPT